MLQFLLPPFIILFLEGLQRFHIINELIKHTLGWLDKYLGPVR